MIVIYNIQNIYIFVLFLSAPIRIASVEPVNSTAAVRVMWTFLNIPVVDHYTVQGE